MNPRFDRRSDETELMDDLSSSGEVIHQTLKELETINKWLGGNSVTLSGLDRLLSKGSFDNRPISIADLGCGSGDMLLHIARWARKKGVKVRLIGVDANPHIIDYAKRNTEQFEEISYEVSDIFSETFREKHFDIMTTTLFTHHFGDEALTALLRQMQQQSRIGIVINDLHRHWFAYYSIKWLTQLFSKSAMVKNDAAVSVLRSFRKSDWEGIARSSGMQQFSLKWRWAFRWQLVAPRFESGQTTG